MDPGLNSELSDSRVFTLTHNHILSCDMGVSLGSFRDVEMSDGILV